MAKFVIADDIESFRLRNAAFVAHAGHIVVGEAANGQQAVDLCRELRPDYVLLDMNMPILGGDAAAHIIMDEQLVRRVIMCSSAGQEATAKPLLDRGAAFISKPYHRADFQVKLARAIGG